MWDDMYGILFGVQDIFHSLVFIMCIMFICIYNFKQTVMVPFKLFANVHDLPYSTYLLYQDQVKSVFGVWQESLLVKNSCACAVFYNSWDLHISIPIFYDHMYQFS